MLLAYKVLQIRHVPWPWPTNKHGRNTFAYCAQTSAGGYIRCRNSLSANASLFVTLWQGRAGDTHKVGLFKNTIMLPCGVLRKDRTWSRSGGRPWEEGSTINMAKVATRKSRQSTSCTIWGHANHKNKDDETPHPHQPNSGTSGTGCRTHKTHIQYSVPQNLVHPHMIL